MKTFKFKPRLITFFILISITFSFNGCSGSDSDSIDDSNLTFLEKYDDTVWRQIDTPHDNFIYIQNNLSNPFINYYTASGECYEATSLNPIYFSIVENTTTTLKIRDDYSNEEYYIYTFSFSDGNMMYNKYEFYYSDITTWDSDLLSTTHNPNSFTLCGG